MSSLTVLIPTLNCRQLLPAHLDAMDPWIHLAGEIIVVDSHSTDGTLDYLRQRLSGRPVTFLTHPRGLYQCWNYGIQQATRQWLYISTVGDTIDKDLLSHLVHLGETTESDTVLSAPTVVDQNNQPDHSAYWPVEDVLKLIPPGSACTLTSEAAHFIALHYAGENTLLGSSASNLYRTSHLQKYPLPTDFGTSGDGAWGLMESIFDTRMACTSRRASTLLLHPKAYASDAYHVDSLEQKLQKLGLRTYHARAERGALTTLRPLPVMELKATKRRLYRELKKLRHQHRPWFIFPSVWAARRASKQADLLYKAELHENMMQIRTKHLAVLNC